MPPISYTVHTLPVYEPSGLVGRQVWWALPAGALAMALVGRAYATVMGLSNHLFIEGLVIFSLATVCVLGTRIVLRWSHARHPVFNLAVAMFLALVLMWARWQTTLGDPWLELSFLQLLFTNPWEWASQWPAMASVQGGSRWLWAWAGEALLVLLCCGAMALHVSSTPYSEPKGAWSEKRFTAFLRPVYGSANDMRVALLQDGLQALLRCPVAKYLPPSAGAAPQVDVQVGAHVVPNDPWGCWVSVTWRTPSVDNKGGVSYAGDILVTQWVLHESAFARLARHVR